MCKLDSYWEAAVGFPDGANGKEPTCQCRRHKRCSFHPWTGKIPLERGMAIHSNILAWRTPWTWEHGRTCDLVGHEEWDMTEAT